MLSIQDGSGHGRRKETRMAFVRPTNLKHLERLRKTLNAWVSLQTESRSALASSVRSSIFSVNGKEEEGDSLDGGIDCSDL